MLTILTPGVGAMAVRITESTSQDPVPARLRCGIVVHPGQRMKPP
jgi:hypothetical protein